MSAYPPEVTLAQVIPLMCPMTLRFTRWVMENDGHDEAEALQFAWNRTDDDTLYPRSDEQRMADGFSTWGESYEDMLHEGEYTIPW